MFGLSPPLRYALLGAAFNPYAFAAKYSPHIFLPYGPDPTRQTASGLVLPYQDDKGTTPATEATDALSMVIEESQGAARGTELASNGRFDADISGWDPTSGAILGWNAAGFLTADRDASANYGATQDLAAGITNRLYMANGRLRSIDNAAHLRVLQLINGSWSVGAGNFHTLSGAAEFDDARVFRFATATGDLRVAVRIGNNVSSQFAADDISVVEIAGHHLVQPTLAAAPTLNGDGSPGNRFVPSFDGGDYWSVPSGPAIHAAGACCMVFLIDGAGQDASTIYAEANNPTGAELFTIRTSGASSSKARVFLQNSVGTILNVTGDAVICDGEPHILTVLLGGGAYAIRVDGVEDKSGSFTDDTISLNTASIGAKVSGSVSNYFSGVDLPLMLGTAVPPLSELAAFERWAMSYYGVAA